MSERPKVGVTDGFADGCFVIGDAHVLARVVWGSGINGEGGALFVRPNVSMRVRVGRARGVGDGVAKRTECAAEDGRGDGTFLDGAESDPDIDSKLPASLLEADLDPVGLSRVKVT